MPSPAWVGQLLLHFPKMLKPLQSRESLELTHLDVNNLHQHQYLPGVGGRAERGLLVFGLSAGEWKSVSSEDRETMDVFGTT